MTADHLMWAVFDGGTLHGQSRLIGVAGAVDWPERYELIPTGERWCHVGAGLYVLVDVLGDVEPPARRPEPLPVAQKGHALHPADRAALATVACFAAGTVALAPVVWHGFTDRWLNAVFAIAAAMAFIAAGWCAHQWSQLGEERDE